MRQYMRKLIENNACCESARPRLCSIFASVKEMRVTMLTLFYSVGSRDGNHCGQEFF